MIEFWIFTNIIVAILSNNIDMIYSSELNIGFVYNDTLQRSYNKFSVFHLTTLLYVHNVIWQVSYQFSSNPWF